MRVQPCRRPHGGPVTLIVAATNKPARGGHGEQCQSNRECAVAQVRDGMGAWTGGCRTKG